MKIITGNYVGFDCCVETCKHIFRSSAPERLVSPPRFARFFIRQVSEFWDHNFSTASDYITAKRDKKASCGHLSEIILIVYDYNYDSNALFGNLLHLCGYQGVEVDDLISILLISTRNNGSFFIFFSRAKKVIQEMPPSHFVDLRLVKTNLDKEGLKFQLEEHAVARILEV